MSLFNKKILLGVTGSIAAYKSAEFIRQLRTHNVQVKVVLTEAAKQFIAPLTLQALSGQHVYSELLNSETEAAMSHIELARWADAVVVAPASANFIAKFAHGFAGDLLNTLCLVTTAPIFIAPAMNQQMWANAATQANIKSLIERTTYILGPDAGLQACGEMGLGRMLEPEALIMALNNFFSVKKVLSNQRIIITAGPTREPVDAVRYLSNYSSGKMGYALAQAAENAGANVLLISGPTDLACPTHVNWQKVTTAKEMYAAVMQNISDCDIFISAAAVADYSPAQILSHKIKKNSAKFSLELLRTPDILAAVAALENKPFTVGFAAETENLLAHAKEKLIKKNLDLVIVNQVGLDKGFYSDDNAVVVITPDNKILKFPLMKKTILAAQLMEVIAQHVTESILSKNGS